MAKRMPRVACVHCVGGTALLDGIVREELPHDCAAIKAAHPEGSAAAAASASRRARSTSSAWRPPQT